MALKIWKVKELDKENALNIAQMFNIPAFVAMLLDIYNVDDVEDYIGLNFEKILDFDFVDIKKAVQRIKVAIDQGEQICICGDYDADGVTSVALLYLYLCSLGANVSYHIPVRNRDGYGLNIQTIDFLSSKGIELIITVDNGVTAVEEIKYAKELGIDTVVTDHHKLPVVLPEAVAIVDLQREGDGKFKELAGVGVVFKLIMALEGEDLDLEFLFENYADLVLIGTIADIVPLVDENRLFSKIGLSYINKTDKIGIISLLKTAGLLKSTLNSTDIAFGLVPRINAAGRLSTTEKVVELLTTDDEARALEIAQMLENENIQRKNLEQKALMQIEALLRKEPERLCEDLLIVNGEDWHPGVIGIVASKLLEKYGKPTIVITKTGNIARGSARSIEGFSIYDAINSCSEYLLKFGGHTMAAGFDIKTEDIARLKEDIKA
ncbi:MAG: single-stranded-DNA-specific exonuclease RecJ, partial [Clostridia bacterium]|nr:single-stranded-DNA-specific exonuclease RecJ [Clostridia bacterium]